MPDPEAAVKTDPGAVRRAARAHNYDWYVAALLAPRHAKADLITLAAFAGEVARIPSLVNEPMMGAVRLQWWRDVLAAEDGGRSGHPVADAMWSLMRRRDLPVGIAGQIIDAQEIELQSEPPEDLEGLKAQLAKSYGPRVSLAVRLLADEPSALRPGVAIAAGQAYGLARLVDELGRGSRTRQILVPQDWLARAGLTVDDFSGPSGSVVSARPVIDALRAECRELMTALGPSLRADGGDRVPRNVLPALLPLALIEPYLGALDLTKAEGAHVRHTDGPTELQKSWRMFVAYWRGVI